MKFYLGTHECSWLGALDIPLFVSHRRLMKRVKLPRALAPWALDSGGFTELSMHGGWMTTRREYVNAVRRYQREVGQLEWCAPMDWMCEPFMLAKTGLSIREHQQRTTDSYLDLRSEGLPVVPVLQGWTLSDYINHEEHYAEHGVDLTTLDRVGLGSVCRRQGTREISWIVMTLAMRGLALHGFGIKMRGLTAYAHGLASSDSMAWSYDARRNEPLPGCTHLSCANCKRWALAWRERLLVMMR